MLAPGPCEVARERGIEAALGLLVGKPWRSLARAATLLSAGFGELRPARNRKGEPVERCEYAFHTESPWRIVGPEGLVAGQYDRWYPRDSTEPEYEPGPEFPTRFERRTEALRVALEAGTFIVEAVELGTANDVTIELSGGYRIEVFAVDSTRREHWRLFEPERDHLVVSAWGIVAGD